MCKSYNYKHIKICFLEFHICVCMRARVCVCVRERETGEIGILCELNGYDVMEKVYAHVCAL